ncbi:MFS transporter [Mycobacterium paragordonae]|uniref:MFS transporter n=1 Tax=Mycobacterium paragordonae TaxID=1389713 RepID=UPI000B2E30BC|nr:MULTISPECIES: MFS transporter [Mycobacterium]
MRLPLRHTDVRVRPAVALAVMCLSIFIAGIDITVVNVALPSLARDLHADNAELQWIVDAYSLTSAGFLLSAGNLGDRYGRRGLLCWGLVLFAAMSALSATAGSPAVLIAARAAMGLGAASIFPTTLALITNIFRDPGQRAKAIGVWSAMGGLGVVVGPIAGGWLVQHVSVGSIFWINVPIAAVAIAGTLTSVPTSRDPAPPPLDVTGLVTSSLGVATLTYTIIEAPNVGWSSARTFGGFVAAALLLAGFIWRERHTAQPMLRPSMFADRRFSGGCLAVSAAYLALFGFVFVMAQYLQFITGYSPFQAGARLLPVAFSIAAASIFAPRIDERLGTTAAVVVGLLSFAAAMGWSATFQADTPYWAIGSAMALFGGGLGLTVACATDSIMGSLDVAAAGVGSAVASASRQLAGSLGVAIVGSAFASVYATSLETNPALSQLDPGRRGTMRQSMAAADQVIAQLPAGQAGSVRHAVEAAFLDGLWVGCLVCAAVAVIAAAAVAAVLPRRASSPEEPIARQQVSPTPDG